jgi:hypothetical protein
LFNEISFSPKKYVVKVVDDKILFIMTLFYVLMVDKLSFLYVLFEKRIKIGLRIEKWGQRLVNVSLKHDHGSIKADHSKDNQSYS